MSKIKTAKKLVEGVTKGFKALTQAEKKAKASAKTSDKKVIRQGDADFRKIQKKKLAEARAKGKKTYSISNVLKKAPSGKGYENKPKKVIYLVERAIDPKTGKKRAKKKDLTGLTEAEKKERKSLITQAERASKRGKKDYGQGDRGSVILSSRVLSLSPKAKGKSAAQIIKEGRVSPVTNKYVNPNLITRASAPLTGDLSKEGKRLRRMTQLGKAPKGFFKNKTDELDVIRGDIPPSLVPSQITRNLRQDVGPAIKQKETRRGGVFGEGKEVETLIPDTSVNPKKLKKFPKRKTIDKTKGRKATTSNIKKQISKIRANNFGGEKKSFADSLLGRQAKPKVNLKTMKSKDVSRQLSFSKTVESADIKKIKKTLEKVENRLMSNPAVATLKDLKSRPLIKNAKPTRVGRKFLGPLRNEKNPYYSIKQRIEKLQQKQKETKPKLVGSIQTKLKAVAGFKDIPKPKEVIKRKSGGMVKYKSGTKKKTIGKKIKGMGKYAMGVLSPGAVYDVMELGDILGTGLKTLGMKSGTKGKTIRGVGKAMRGYGKAITGRKK